MSNFHCAPRELFHPNDPRRIFRFSIPDVKHAPVTAASGTGTIVDDATLSNETVNVSITAGMQPTCLRELVIGQEDDSGTSLTTVWTISYRGWDGALVTVTKTLTGASAFYAFPEPVSKLVSVSYTITNSATDDHILCGYRGIAIEGFPIKPVSQFTILQEIIAGDSVSSAGTISSTTGFYNPASLADGDSLSLYLRYEGSENYKTRDYASATITTAF